MKADFKKWLEKHGYGCQDFDTHPNPCELVNQYAEEYAKQEVTRNLLKAAIVHDGEKKQEALEAFEAGHSRGYYDHEKTYTLSSFVGDKIPISKEEYINQKFKDED